MKMFKTLTAALAGSLLTLTALSSVPAVASPVETRVARGEEQQNPRGQETQNP